MLSPRALCNGCTHTWFGPFGTEIHVPEPTPAAMIITSIVVQPDMSAELCTVRG